MSERGRAAAGERVLRLCVSRERAAEMIGDLLEVGPGVVRFWVGVICMLLAFSWRTILACLLSPFIAGLIGSATFKYSARYAESHGRYESWLHALQMQPHSPAYMAFGLTTPLWLICSFSLLSFGFDAFTKIAVCAALLAGITFATALGAGGLTLAVLPTLCFIAYAVSDEKRRRACVAVIAAVSISKAIQGFSAPAEQWLAHHHLAPLFLLASMCSWILLPCLIVLWVHRRFMKPVPNRVHMQS